MEKLEEVWDQYEIKRKRMFRGKKCLMCQSDSGLYYGIGVTKHKEGHLYRERFAKEYLQSHGYDRIDQLVYNKNDKLYTQDRYHTPYVVRTFFVGTELDVSSLEEVHAGAQELAKLHSASLGMESWLYEEEKKLWECRKQHWNEEWENAELEENEERQERLKKSLLMRAVPDHFRNSYDCVSPVMADEWLESRLQKKNRELKRISDYMRKSVSKNAFADFYNRYAPEFLHEGKNCVSFLQKVYRENSELRVELGMELRTGFVHGNYQHHNILKDENGWALIGFDHFRFAPQVMDLYDYMRKVLEKNEYQFPFAKAILQGYETYIPLDKQEFLCLYLLLCYPDKFWKISNHYYNAKKTWVAPKMIEKLSNVVIQNQQKQEFLVKFREDYLDWVQ